MYRAAFGRAELKTVKQAWNRHSPCTTILKTMAKTKVQSNIELEEAVESLEQIADDLDSWVEEQRDKFKYTTSASRKKWISDWFSGFYIMELLDDNVNDIKFSVIVDTFRFDMPNIAESLEDIWDNVLHCVKFMQQIEKDRDRVEDNHDLGFWCVNFLDKAATPTVKHLRHIVQKTKENLARHEKAERLRKLPDEVLNRQVGELLRSSPPDISATEIAGTVNKYFAGEYRLTSPCEVGKTENWKRHRRKQKSRKKK